ncbi:MAG: hypothetical protein JNM18_24025 [Planctomycetaceae bacterium]|nr:hypothetical protein [Planctomycetaceae bacterium]
MSSISDELLNVFGQLQPAEQQVVLKLAKSLATGTPKGTPGNELLRFAACISSTEADEMERVIERDCERIDESAW